MDNYIKFFRNTIFESSDFYIDTLLDLIFILSLYWIFKDYNYDAFKEEYFLIEEYEL